PRENEAVNETWIADRDRYSYAGMNGADRLTEPMIRRDGAWVTVDWTAALTLVAGQLKAAVAEQTGWLIAPTATLEEMFLAQAIARGLGCPNIDHRLRQRDFRGDAADPLRPWLGVTIPELEVQEGVLLIGSDLRQEQPLLAHRLRQAVLAGGSLAVINPYRLDLTHPATQLVGSPDGMVVDLAAIAQVLGVSGAGQIQACVAQAVPNEIHQAVAESLKAAGANGKGLLLLGALATAHPDYSVLKALAYLIVHTSGCRVGYLPAAANSVGAYLAGALPQVQAGGQPAAHAGLPVTDMLAAPLKTLFLWGLEPDLDLGNPTVAMAALGQADFVVAASAFRSSALESVAQVLLPIGAFAETSGTYVNGAGTWQGFQGAVAPPGEARPGWKVLRVLGNLLGLPGFEYSDTAAIRAELATLCQGAAPDNTPVTGFDASPRGTGEGLIRIGHVPIYAVDPVVRRAPALQRTPAMASAGVALHPEQAAALDLVGDDPVQVRQGGAVVLSRVRIDDHMPLGCVLIPAGVAGSEFLGDQIAPVSLSKA
ncbi:MAG TPA: molybdopterin-dependent oxidoreductase, partial [Lamprocystis sp. (in: g-proteobacteria)]|nr:molybdopterin-dependent oxidoreductase [Lamprocystis sp. (in: g-proteobacteria)]